MKIVSANGASIPALGFGTFRMPGPDTERMVAHVLGNGYRHIDTAQIYGNEADVGKGILRSGIARGDLFLTTKVWVENYRHDAFIASVDESLKKLKTDYVDLLLLHWPNDAVPLAEQIAALNEVAKAGKVRHIGVSNFNRALMREAVRLSDLPLVTNQVEYHPYLDQSPILEAAASLGMSVTAYYAMADGKVLSDPMLKDIAARHGKSIAQIVLRWIVQQGLIVLSKTVSEDRAAKNAAIFDFALSQDEMAAIHALAQPNGRIVSPDGLAPIWDEAA
ncbi:MULTISPECIES: aldo/keto reductase [unclassified Rhizobium]|jgi:diketogulonate reductase-like aldo/keto reductase|uniref:aldo/keto reductase n=1 Tax=unclassified Rhizobium TaxID=2613769 RepID=UPI001619176D|nr:MULTISPECIES: aldo/keto reductase [unclassified Rhizobium]MBB3285254.1 diketogulonate reductase-like aldo/keto reductase [Rhizobium sp. BK252]MBB3399993.1 diketogulonate reductase-like aldo/keto reductase [Rhizobium sp. BK289]MBB3412573.1 diketogulonate reductase-like aldo/keto reductase [Rhizobium sp. BK284]MBB3480459.1 diketogulonate reductase-like aldo/keto reductase [Rhizobium sp. BK347]MDK4719132.1 aldo/keto reductase [Rhizobium sp. CNPSo 3968]